MQTPNPPREKGNSRDRQRVWPMPLLIMTLVVLVLFGRSFQPGQVVFSNDSPLGAVAAQADYPLSAFTGYWQDLNWLGTEQPSAIPGPTQGLFILLGPLIWGANGVVIFAKFYAPLALLLTGLAGFILGRSLGLSRLPALLVGLAALLNSDSFSHACWGLPSISLGLAATMIALALLHHQPPSAKSWRHLILAGFAVGLAVMESYDVGAILSLYVAAFVLWQAVLSEGKPGMRAAKGVGWVALVAVAAVFISAQALSTLVGTQVKGVSGMAQDDATRAARWGLATQWSLPKRESLQMIVPGLFGYRMDTPDGGWYWGGIGRDRAWDDYLADPNPDPTQAPVGALMRHSGAGFYTGIFVVLLAAWGFVHSWRRNGNPYSPYERRSIWFWTGAALISLLLAYGRHAPFYQIIYQLPFFSTVRNPIKFLHPLQISLIILFGYGLLGLWRGYLEPIRSLRSSVIEQLQEWWRTTTTADRRWVIGSGTTVVLAGFAWLLYMSSTASMVAHLGRVGFTNPEMAREIARFSANQAGFAFLFLAASVVLVVLIMAGIWAGQRQRWLGLAVGVILVTDMARANLPWIVYYDYREKYATNELIEFLRTDASQHRVTGRLTPTGGDALVNEEGQVFASLYHEWLEHLFQYYNIQSLDIVQMPRTPTLDEAYLRTFQPASRAEFKRIGRLWELTNTRYVLGMTGFVDFMNQQFDPGQGRFRVHTAFTILPKPGMEQITQPSQLTVQPDSNGPFALFEFGGALPRVLLLPQWEVVTDDAVCLERLASPDFNPHHVVLVNQEMSEPTAPADEAMGGSVLVEHYAPKRIQLKAVVTAPSVLLLNDRYHPDWRVYVNGQRRDLLRCNHIMRGVHLEPGEHQVEFRFQPGVTPLFISLAALAVGLVLLILVFAVGPRQARQPVETRTHDLEPRQRAPRRR